MFVTSMNFVSASLGVQVELNKEGISYGHELLWRTNATGTFDEETCAVWANGVLYVNSLEYKKVYAINATTGGYIWNFSIGSFGGLAGGWGGPSYYEGVIYTAFYNLFAINATTGEEIWNYSLPNVNFSQGPAVDEKYVATVSFLEHIVQVVNRTTGEHIWNVSIGTNLTSEPLLFEDYLVIAVFGGGTKDLVAYNITNGVEIWTADTGGYWDGSPILYNNIIYIGESSGSNLRARYLNNGSEFWTASWGGPTSSSPAIHNGLVFISPVDYYNALLKAYNSSTGSLIWTFKEQGTSRQDSSYSQISISNGLIFFNTLNTGGVNPLPEGYMYAINESDGSLIWKYFLPDSILGDTSIAQGNIYIVTDDSYLYAFDFGAGGGNWTLTGYNSNRTSYCDDCITEWQYVKSNCTTDINTTCTITNNYDHTVYGINLTEKGLKSNWYNSSGNLVASNSLDYIISELSPSEAKTFTIVPTGEIVDCAKIVSSGVYTLAADIIKDYEYACFNISANDVILDCQSHKINRSSTYFISGNSLYGFYVQRDYPTNTNITLKNCVVEDTTESPGIYLENSSLNNLINITSNSNSYGVFLNNSDWNSITNLGSSSDSYSVYLYNSNFNTINNISNSGLTYTFYLDNSSSNILRNITGGIYFANFSSSNNITNVFTDSNFGTGFEIYNSDLNLIINLTTNLNDMGNGGVYLFNSDSNRIINLISNLNIGPGFSLYNSNSNTIINPTLTGNWPEIYLDNSSFNNFSEMEINVGDWDYGITIQGYSNSNIFSESAITTVGNDAYCIYFQTNSDNNSFSEMIITANNSNTFPVYIYDTDHNFSFLDSIINSSYDGVSELYVAGDVTGGVWNFTNTTKTDGSRINTTWSGGAAGTFNNLWRLNIRVNNSLGYLENATVSVWDRNGDLLFSENTGVDGSINVKDLLEYSTINGSSLAYYTPHTINITKTGYESNSTIYNATLEGNIDHLVILSDTAPPEVTIVSPASEQIFSTSFVSFEVHTNENSSCNYSLDFGTTNYSLTANSTGTGHTNSISLSNGDYTVNYYCFDIFENANNTNLNVSFSVSASSYKNSPSASGNSVSYFWEENYFINQSQFNQGYLKELKTKQRFEIRIKGKNHYIGVVSLNSTNAVINVSSISQQKILGIGGEWKVEITGDSYYDLIVKLNNITDSKAEVFVKSINEKINQSVELLDGSHPVQIQNRTNADNDSNDLRVLARQKYYLIGGIIISILFIGYSLIRGYKTRRKNQ